MGRVRRHILLDAFKAFDLGLMLLSFALATLPVLHEANQVSLAHFLSIRVRVQNLVLLGSLLVLWHLIFVFLGMYESRRLSDRRSEVIDVLKATSLGTLCIGVAAVVFRIEIVDRVFLAVFWASATSSAVLSRLALRSALGRIRTHNRNLRYMVIVGANSRAIDFARKIEAKPELGYRILGFVDEQWSGMQEIEEAGYPLICDLADFPAFLRDSVVDEVVMTLPVKSCYQHASRIAALCEEQGIVLRLFGSIFNLKIAQSRAEEFEGEHLITHSSTQLDDWPAVVKRVMDFLLSLALIILLSPVFLLAALLIRLTSPGPIFFLQKRMGLGKRRFSVYKFRTMVPDAERRMAELEHLNEVSGPVFKIKNDPRITPIGKVLRKTSIDELPQLFNVLKGDMSLVGPRPLPVRDYEGFDHDWQRRRFSVRPGITCLWQINGRSSVSFDQWMQLDMQYIDKWSLWLDLKILARTIPAVLRGSGAA